MEIQVARIDQFGNEEDAEVERQIRDTAETGYLGIWRDLLSPRVSLHKFRKLTYYQENIIKLMNPYRMLVTGCQKLNSPKNLIRKVNFHRKIFLYMKSPMPIFKKNAKMEKWISKNHYSKMRKAKYFEI